jgi:hypothetical protein
VKNPKKIELIYNSTLYFLKELSTNLNLVTARANKADDLKTALATAESEKKEYRQTIQAYQTQFW